MKGKWQVFGRRGKVDFRKSRAQDGVISGWWGSVGLRGPG